MAIYSQQQIANLAASVGFKDTNMASSIAMAESGGDTAIGPNATGDTGLWQISLQAHPQYTVAQMRDPVQNARAAYAISSGGTNWRDWCTAWSDGACGTNGGSYQGRGSPYIKFLGKTGTPMANTPLPTLDHKPWWQFPRIDNMGQPDPFGGFPKPDSNIQIPPGYPVEALLPGTVSGINNSSSYSTVITILLDKPLNSLATHTFYEHLRGDVQVRVGQHVNTGQLIAYNGSAQATGSEKIPLGFGLYNGDNYAFGAAWNLMTRSNLNGGPLDPVPLLNQAAKGSIPNLPGGSGDGSSVGSATGGAAAVANVVFTTIETVSQAAYQKINHVDGFLGICETLDLAETFVPFYLPSAAQQDINTINQPQNITVFGFNTGIDNPVANVQTAKAALQLPSDAIQAVLVFATTNFMAFAVRSLFVTIGIILGTALIINAVSSMVDIKDIGQAASGIAAIAA